MLDEVLAQLAANLLAHPLELFLERLLVPLDLRVEQALPFEVGAARNFVNDLEQVQLVLHVAERHLVLLLGLVQVALLLDQLDNLLIKLVLLRRLARPGHCLVDELRKRVHVDQVVLIHRAVERLILSHFGLLWQRRSVHVLPLVASLVRQLAVRLYVADLPLLRHVGRLKLPVGDFAVLKEEVAAFALLGGVAQLAKETTAPKILQVLHLLLQLEWVCI